MSNAELASSYAALILADEGLEITVRFYLNISLPAGKCKHGGGAMCMSVAEKEEAEEG